MILPQDSRSYYVVIRHECQIERTPKSQKSRTFQNRTFISRVGSQARGRCMTGMGGCMHWMPEVVLAPCFSSSSAQVGRWQIFSLLQQRSPLPISQQIHPIFWLRPVVYSHRGQYQNYRCRGRRKRSRRRKTEQDFWLVIARTPDSPHPNQLLYSVYASFSVLQIKNTVNITCWNVLLDF